MKKMIRVIIAMFVVVMMLPISNIRVTADTTEISTQVTGTYRYSKVNDIIVLINQERTKEGLSSLTMDKDLLEAAMKRATEIAVLFSHQRPDGTDWYTVSHKVYGENVAMGNVSAEEIMNMWMNSEGHKNNILKSDFSTVGIGCFETNGEMYWVQLFGKGEVEPVGTLPDDYETTANISTDKNANNTGTSGDDNKGNNGGQSNTEGNVTTVVNGTVPKTRIKKLKKVSLKKVSIKIKKVRSAEGYEVSYATSKKFKRSIVKTVKKVNIKIGKLKKGKKYFFKVRAYITDANGNKVYGQYSKVKKIKL